MPIYAYFNNGKSLRAVDPFYEAETGEVIFDHLATTNELVQAFPTYLEPDVIDLTPIEQWQQDNVTILTQITSLEAKQTPRLIREVFLEAHGVGPFMNPTTGKTSTQTLTDINTQVRNAVSLLSPKPTE